MTAAGAPGRGLWRPIELIITITLLGIALPILGSAWLAIRLSSSGGAIFRQTRVGCGGRPFQILKLRTMRSDVGGPLLTSGVDHRVTTVGRLLRRTKLDELPQLWNVLCGDMALVGPRPEVPRFVDLESPIWQRVLSARPGITDPVSIRLRDEARWLESLPGDPETVYRRRLLPWKLAGYDAYLTERTPWRDLGVLWQTLIAVVFTTGEEVPASELSDVGEGNRRPNDVDP